MVIAMITAAITHPTAIQRPPKTIHKRLSTRAIGDMPLYVRRLRASAIGGGEPAIKNATDPAIEGCVPAITMARQDGRGQNYNYGDRFAPSRSTAFPRSFMTYNR
jgi:hypothetical protein